MSTKTTMELDTNTALIVGAIGMPIVLAISVGVGLADAFVLWKLWSWYAVPLGAIAVPFGAMLAADMFVSILTTHLRPERPDAGSWKRMGLHLLALALAFVVAWLFT